MIDERFKYDHSDFCHCSDYDPSICPEQCFRARITQELKEVKPPYPYPVSMANFRNSGYCPLTEMEDNNDMSDY